MHRRAWLFVIGAAGLSAWIALLGSAVEPRVIRIQKARDVTVSLLNDSGQWTVGSNEFVVEFTSATDSVAVDVGKVALNTAMPMPGMPPMLAGATLVPERTPGRYRGTISFDDHRGDRQVTVTWDGPVGKGSTRFPVAVR